MIDENSKKYIIDKLKLYYHESEVLKIIDGLSVDRLTTFRVNHIKTNQDEILKEFDRLNIAYKSIEGFDDAFILFNVIFESNKHIDKNTNICIDDLDLYKNGCIYFQSLSSMLPVKILDPKQQENILDMCAAPGGKTTQIQSITQNKANLTATELNKKRFERLKYNVNTQGANVYLINTNALDLDDMFKFDKILLDAPCSGSGILDLNDKNNCFNDDLIYNCIAKQIKLINKAYKLLKNNGILVYSTCSILNPENEENIGYAKNLGFEIEYEKKILPNELYEGFYIAKLIKK